MAESSSLLLSLFKAAQHIAIEKKAELKAINQYAALSFTPFRFVDTGEVQTTHLLAFFLNPDEDHGQGEIFQNAFLLALTKSNPQFKIPPGPYKVQAEKRHDGVRQIDLLLRSPANNFGICVENKFYAKDQVNQLTDYNSYLIKEFGATNYLLLYLTPQNRPPDHASISPNLLNMLASEGKYYNLTYQNFILPLLDKWAENAFPQKIKLFLRDFRHMLELTLNLPSTSPAPLMHQDEIAKLLLQNPDYLKLAYDFPGIITTAEKQLRGKFFYWLNETAAKYDLTSNNNIRFSNFETYATLTMGKEDWGKHKIAFEFDGQQFYYGVLGNEPTSYLKKSLEEKLFHASSSIAWPWYNILFNRFQPLYLEIAQGTIQPKLEEQIRLIAQALNQLLEEGFVPQTAP